jgi:CheY-like chemotaxis protein
VLLDLMMPVMDGLSFLHVIRADPHSAHLPVVVITAKELTAAEAGQLERETLRVMSKSEVFGGEFKHMLEVVLQSARNRTTAAATGAQTW